MIGIAAMLLMKIDWLQFCEGLVRIPEALGKLIQIDFSQIDITFSSLLESIGVAVLSTVYSMVGGMILAVFLAKNLTPSNGSPRCFRCADLPAGHSLHHLGTAGFGMRGLWPFRRYHRHLHFQHLLLLPGPLPNALKRCPRKH